MSKDKRYDRRKFLTDMAMLVGASELSMFALKNLSFIKNDEQKYMNANHNDDYSLGPIKQIDAGVLNVGYAESGPATGTYRGDRPPSGFYPSLWIIFLTIKNLNNEQD